MYRDEISNCTLSMLTVFTVHHQVSDHFRVFGISNFKEIELKCLLSYLRGSIIACNDVDVIVISIHRAGDMWISGVQSTTTKMTTTSNLSTVIPNDLKLSKQSSKSFVWYASFTHTHI